MLRSRPTGDLAADLVVEILQHLVHSTGSVPRISTVDACLLLDTASADVGETYFPNKEKQGEMHKLREVIRQRLLATNKGG